MPTTNGGRLISQALSTSNIDLRYIPSVKMVADRKARADLQDALASYMRGDISTFAFDDRNSAYFEGGQTQDQSVLEISRVLWTMHDDFVDHPISVSREGWLFLKRVVTFLDTDLELRETPRWTRLSEFWPFRDATEWSENESTGLDRQIPDYDPDKHGRPIGHWWNRIPTLTGFAIILAMLAVVFYFGVN
ncbi:MAG: hypothetical protein JSS02_18000 [Planctomycetes bacterium]|nr:hypothetical protein [Planctomycetota bacterium]